MCRCRLSSSQYLPKLTEVISLPRSVRNTCIFFPYSASAASLFACSRISHMERLLSSTSKRKSHHLPFVTPTWSSSSGLTLTKVVTSSITSVDLESKLGTSDRTDALTMKRASLPPRIGPHWAFSLFLSLLQQFLLRWPFFLQFEH